MTELELTPSEIRAGCKQVPERRRVNSKLDDIYYRYEDIKIRAQEGNKKARQESETVLHCRWLSRQEIEREYQ